MRTSILVLMAASIAVPAQASFIINASYDTTVPAAAQAAFNSVISTYEGLFTNNVTVNIDVTFGTTGLAQSSTAVGTISYAGWRSSVISEANAHPENLYLVAAAATLPATNPLGSGKVTLTFPEARALGFSAATSVDSTLTFSSASNIFEYGGVAQSGRYDFMDVASHELDEALGIGSALTGLANNASVASSTNFAAEDYYRYSANGTRAVNTNPSANVYFSYNGGATNVAQFNQDNNAGGNSTADRNDWVYGNSGCPATTVYIQDAIGCPNQAVPIGVGPEITVLQTLGWNPASSAPEPGTWFLCGAALIACSRLLRLREG